MVVAILRATVDFGIYNAIVLVAMAAAAENWAHMENILEDSGALYSFLSSNVQFSPLLVSIIIHPHCVGPNESQRCN